eukprot:577954-Prymnesium_polylepis.1
MARARWLKLANPPADVLVTQLTIPATSRPIYLGLMRGPTSSSVGRAFAARHCWPLRVWTSVDSGSIPHAQTHFCGVRTCIDVAFDRLHCAAQCLHIQVSRPWTGAALEHEACEKCERSVSVPRWCSS